MQTNNKSTRLYNPKRRTQTNTHLHQNSLALYYCNMIDLHSLLAKLHLDRLAILLIQSQLNLINLLLHFHFNFPFSISIFWAGLFVTRDSPRYLLHPNSRLVASPPHSLTPTIGPRLCPIQMHLLLTFLWSYFVDLRYFKFDYMLAGDKSQQDETADLVAALAAAGLG